MQIDFAGHLETHNVDSLKNGFGSNALLSFRRLIHSSPQTDDEATTRGSNFRSMEFVRNVVQGDSRGGFMNNRQRPKFNVEQQEVDFVNIKLMRNNTFVTVTNSKGEKKAGASAGCISDMKGPKLSRYAAEATAERVGRMCRDLALNGKLKSVVIRVKGFAPFFKKKQAIMRWKEGFSGNSGGRVHGAGEIVYIEDTTRRAHNGCRLRKQRRI